MDGSPFRAFFEAMQSLIVGMMVLIVVLATIALFLALALGVTYLC